MKFRRMVAGLATLALLLQPIHNAAYSQELLPEALRTTLSEAATVSDEALVEAVSVAVQANPELAQAIVDEAILLNPDLQEEIVTAAAAAGGEVQVAAAIGPAIGLGPALLGVAGVGGVAAVAAGGGGGGGGDDGGGAPAPPPVTPGDPDDFETSEYDAQFGLGSVNASDAYARGLSGNGVVVAVIDSGVDINHPEFAGRIASGGFDFIDGSGTVKDIAGHGTSVAGVIAANRNGTGMHGVAFGAQIMPFRAGGTFRNDLSLSTAAITASVNRARQQGADIINNSFGIVNSNIGTISSRQELINILGTPLVDAYDQAAQAKIINVWSAGNNGFSNPSFNAGAPRFFPEVEDLWVAVVSTNENGQISGFSNRCGVAAAWCIAAPGGGIVTTDTGGGYRTVSGTSFSAPHVSGALAILMELFPGLTPEAIIDRMFATANKSGIYANQATFGQGLLDLEAATRPVGAVAVLTGDTIDGASFGIGTTTINLGPAFGDGLRASLQGTTLAVFDSYNATFLVDLEPFVALADTSFDMDAALSRFGQGSRTETIDLGNDMEVSYRFSSSPHVDGKREVVLGELSFRSQVTKETDLLFNYDVSPATAFGLLRTGAVDQNEMASTGAFGTPYLSFADEGYNFGSRTSLGKNASFGVSSFFGNPENDDDVTAYGSAAELSIKSDRGEAGLQFGVLAEQNSFLGTKTEGAFDLEAGSQTVFAGLSGSLPVSAKLDLVGSVYAGWSDAPTSEDSLISDMSIIRTEAFTVGLVGNEVLQKRDRLGFLVNQPLRVANGDATVSAATGRDRAGNLFKTSFDADLAPTGRELDFEVFYNMQMADESDVSFSAMLRSDPGHVDGVDDEGILMMRFNHQF